MKIRGKRIRQYAVWLWLLLGVDAFAALLLWIADVQAFRAMVTMILLATVFLFSAVCFVLVRLEEKREQAFWAFLSNPDEYHEELLLGTVPAAWAEAIHLLGETLREQQYAYEHLQMRLVDYEEYVELWAHETKTPLSLLTFLLDNRRDELPETVEFKLEHIRSKMQESIEQMLFYARLKSGRKDYLFEQISIRSCVEDVLGDYRPLLEEKQFKIQLHLPEGEVYSDRRGLRFLLGQVISNAIKYSGKEPELCFEFFQKGQVWVLSIRDNGMGVRDCDLPYIFEKGFTGDSGKVRKKATGMGLYLAKGIAEDMNLFLEAESEWGKGFKMRISFR